ncbi:putative TIM8-translocase of the mitochondrial inner membrane [Cladochytrium replicatum]|nr:putative TIM8-translocase of the mitochondrial inner membrane [Cladochytrium replicatum]
MSNKQDLGVLGLDDKSQKELATFIENEERRAAFQRSVHVYADTCWDKCITKVKANLDKSDEVCLTNCVERFLDTSLFVIQRFNETAGSRS